MSSVTIDSDTGVLVVDGKSLFPLGVSNPPPAGVKAPSGKDGLQEIARAGIDVIRSGRGD